MFRKVLAASSLVLIAGVGVLSQGFPPMRPNIYTADKLQERYTSGKEHLLKLADRMPEAEYGFSPTPAMEPFGTRIAHVADINFELCSYVVGKPNPYQGAKLEAKFTKKPELIKLMEESFAYCDDYMAKLTPQSVARTIDVKAPPGAKFDTFHIELGCGALDVITHNVEMYGYLSVYLRLKGLVPPTSGKG